MVHSLNTGKIKFEWITTWQDVWNDSFLSLWRNWMSNSPNANVFFEPSVVRAWFDTYASLRNIEPRFLVARLEDECIVFLPLIYDRGGWKDAWQRSIVPVGFSEFDYHDPIVSGNFQNRGMEIFWNELQPAIKDQWARMYESFQIPRLRFPPDNISSNSSFRDEVPWIDISQFNSVESFVSQKGLRHRREEVHRRIRKLEEHGSLSHVVYDRSGSTEAKEFLSQFMNAHSRRWPNASTPYSFYANLYSNCLDEKLLVMSSLRLNMEPISWRLLFVYRDTLLIYVQAFLPDYASFSPGSVHFAYVLDWAMKKGLKRVILGRGKEKWKTEWTRESFPLYSIGWESSGMRPYVCRLWQVHIRPKLVQVKRMIFKRAPKTL